MDFKRQDGESQAEFFMRVGRAVTDAKEMTWEQAAEVLNADSGTTKDESSWRKAYRKYFPALSVAKYCSMSEQLEEIRAEKLELEKIRVQVRDERTALNAKIRDSARVEYFKEIFEAHVKAFDPHYEFDATQVQSSPAELIVMLSDCHIGLKINNCVNVYNATVANNRLRAYCRNIGQIIKSNGVTVCHLVLGGDLVSGIIHPNLRIENDENVVDQVMTASELISQFASVLGNMVPEVRVYNIAGNHSRVFPNKELHFKGENLDNLIPFYMKARLQNYSNIKFVGYKLDESVGTFTCCDKLIAFCHGDKDTPQKVVQDLTSLLGEAPDIVLMGHRHKNGLTTVQGSKVVESGCLSGVDNFAFDKRLFNKPEQVALLVDDSGIRCFYDIQL